MSIDYAKVDALKRALLWEIKTAEHLLLVEASPGELVITLTRAARIAQQYQAESSIEKLMQPEPGVAGLDPKVSL